MYLFVDKFLHNDTRPESCCMSLTLDVEGDHAPRTGETVSAGGVFEVVSVTSFVHEKKIQTRVGLNDLPFEQFLILSAYLLDAGWRVDDLNFIDTTGATQEEKEVMERFISIPR